MDRKRIRQVSPGLEGSAHPPGRPDDVPRSSVKWLGPLALRRDPAVLILTAGAVWTSAMVVGGATAMAPIAGWLWLTVLFVIRRAATRERSTHTGHPTGPDHSPTAP
jgi:hypothetical protein